MLPDGLRVEDGRHLDGATPFTGAVLFPDHSRPARVMDAIGDELTCRAIARVARVEDGVVVETDSAMLLAEIAGDRGVMSTDWAPDHFGDSWIKLAGEPFSGRLITFLDNRRTESYDVTDGDVQGCSLWDEEGQLRDYDGPMADGLSENYKWHADGSWSSYGLRDYGASNLAMVVRLNEPGRIDLLTLRGVTDPVALQHAASHRLFAELGELARYPATPRVALSGDGITDEVVRELAAAGWFRHVSRLHTINARLTAASVDVFRRLAVAGLLEFETGGTTAGLRELLDVLRADTVLTIRVWS